MTDAITASVEGPHVFHADPTVGRAAARTMAVLCLKAGGTAEDLRECLQALGIITPPRPRPRPARRVTSRITSREGHTVWLECGHKTRLARARGLSAVCPDCSEVA